jgi:hypothetical protein
MLASGALSWLLRSATAGTLLGIFLTITLMPISSIRGGLATGGLLGGVAGALADAVLFSPERGVGRIFITTAYGVLLGALWGIVNALVYRIRSGKNSRPKSELGTSPDTPPRP